MISLTSGTSSSTLLDYLAQSATSSDATSTSSADSSSTTATTTATTTSSTSAAVKAKLAASAQAALQTAAGRGRASIAGHALDKQQGTLANDLRAALSKAGVKLGGAIEFSVGSDGSVSTTGSDADKAATNAVLKADTSKPSLVSRIATQASDALKLSATVQQSAAVSQAARYGGRGGVMSMYTSLMQQSSTAAAVFSVAAGSSSLTYPGSLTAKA